MQQTRLLALRWVAFPLLIVWGAAGHAIGLGPIHMESGLGDPLRANIVLSGVDHSDVATSCVKARVSSSDGAFIVAPKIGVSRSEQSSTIFLTSSGAIDEPAVTIVLDIGCNGTIHREYQVLLDPPAVVRAAKAEARLPAAVGAPPRAKPASKAVPPAQIAQSDSNSPVINGSPAKNSSAITRHPTKQVVRPLPAQAIDAELKKMANTPVEPSTAARPAKPKPATEPRRSALKLSVPDQLVPSAQTVPTAGVDTPFQSHASVSKDGSDPLRMSLGLSRPRTDAVLETEEFKAAAARFAATMRDEDPEKKIASELKAAQARVKALQAEAAQSQSQIQLSQAKLGQSGSATISPGWIAGLGAALLLVLMGCSWLVWRMQLMRKPRSNDWWANTHGTSDSLYPTQTGMGTSQNNAMRATSNTHDTEESGNSVFNTNFDAHVAEADADADASGLDLVLEAEIYISYGRDAQAEEILKEALRILPDKTPAVLKLLEIYATRKDLKTFASMAEELYSVTHGKGKDWQKVANLGARIDPENPLYEGGRIDPDLARARIDTEKVPSQFASAELLGEDAPESNAAGELKAEATDPHDLSWVSAIALPQIEPKSPQFSPPQVADTPTAPSQSAAEEVKREDAAIVEAKAFEEDGVDPHDLSWVSAFSLPQSEPKASPQAAAPTTPSFEASVAEEPLPALQFDFGDEKQEVVAATSFAAPLDIALATPAVAAEKIGADPEVAHEKPIAISEPQPEIFDASAMDTRLDLALAYQEIGDDKGALELIDEVIQGGTEEQVRQAKAMRSGIA